MAAPVQPSEADVLSALETLNQYTLFAGNGNQIHMQLNKLENSLKVDLRKRKSQAKITSFFQSV